MAKLKFLALIYIIVSVSNNAQSEAAVAQWTVSYTSIKAILECHPTAPKGKKPSVENIKSSADVLKSLKASGWSGKCEEIKSKMTPKPIAAVGCYDSTFSGTSVYFINQSHCLQYKNLVQARMKNSKDNTLAAMRAVLEDAKVVLKDEAAPPANKKK